MEELAQKLERSEAGRKKLRQAIAILQEKLDGMEKVLKINDKLRLECEQEKKRTESEKQKAEEEKRLKLALEKDSNAVKDQVAKILQRLGAVENKQRADKKELERLRNEVKLSVEGIRVASQAVNAVQNSLQNLETTLVEKVNVTFEEAHAATLAVNNMQSSLQSIEQALMKQESSPNTEAMLQVAGRATQKLVGEISQLFNKERQSHCKIERRLSMLKSAFGIGRRIHSPTDAENIVDLQSRALTKKKKKEKASKKRKSLGEGENIVRRSRKRQELSSVAARNSEVIGMDSIDKDESLSSPQITVQQRISVDLVAIPSHNTASNDFNEEMALNHRDSSTGNANLVSLKEGTAVMAKENSDCSRKNVNGNDCQNQICSSGLIPGDFSSAIHKEEAKRAVDWEEHPHTGISACMGRANAPGNGVCSQDKNATTDSDLDSVDSSEKWWWSSEKVLLSPTLPEILSPSRHSPDPLSEPTQFMEHFETANGCHTSCKVPMKIYSVSCEATDLQGGAGGMRDTTTSCNCQFNAEATRTGSCFSNSPGISPSIEKQQKQLSRDPSATHMSGGTSTEKGVEHVTQCTQWNQNSCVSFHEAGFDSETNKNECVHFEAQHRLDPRLIPSPGLENEIATQFEDCMLEAVNDAPLAELDEFLNVLPPLPDPPPRRCDCSSDLSSTQPGKLVGINCLHNEKRSSNRSTTVSERDMFLNGTGNYFEDKFCEKGHERNSVKLAVAKGCSAGTHMEHVISPTFQQIPTQREPCGLEPTKQIDPMETSNNDRIQELQMSTSNPSSPCKIFSLPPMFLVQAFELQDSEAQINLTAACMLINKLEQQLVCEHADEVELLLQKTTDFKMIVGLPLLYVSCCIISSVVVIARSRKGGVDELDAAKHIQTLLQAYVAFIRRIFIGKANMVLNAILAQLSRFLVDGEAMLVTLQGLVSSYSDVLDLARVIHNKKQCTYHLFEANLDDVYAGGKVLATLCQVLACVTHLQNIVYDVLGWCDKDVMWLLTVFSSFSSICGHTAFMAEADDLLGHAICAIIIELVASVEQEGEGVSEKKAWKVSPLSDLEKRHLASWVSLKKVLKTWEICTISEVVVLAFAALEYLLRFSKGMDLPFLSTVFTCKHCFAEDNIQKQKKQSMDTSLKRVLDNLFSSRNVQLVCNSMPESLGNQRDPALESPSLQKWQRKYMEVVGALELIADFLGWNWTYNNLIRESLWRLIAPGSNQIQVAGVSLIFRILTRIAAKHGGNNLPGLIDLKKCISIIIKDDSTLLGIADAMVKSELQQPLQHVY